MSSKSPTKQKRNNNLGFNWIELIFCITFILILHPPGIKFFNSWIEHFVQREYYSKYPSHILHGKFKNLRLQKGYLVNRLFDLSDRQYEIFRRFIFIQLKPFSIFLIITTTIRFYMKKYYKNHIKTDKSNHYSLVSYLSKYLMIFYCIINICVTYYFHGTTATFILIVMLINYFISKQTYTYKYANIISWISNIFIIFLIIKIDRIYWSFEYLISSKLKWIDGLIRQRMRFTQTFRFILLRCISFNMDLRYNFKSEILYESKFETNIKNINDYSLLNYFGYTLYAPLNFTGPIISFHDWISQIQTNISNTNPYYLTDLKYKNIILYLIRFLIIIMITELFLHYFYLPLISRYDPFPIYLNECKTDYDYAMKIILLSIYCYFFVLFLWAKFLLIWRYQRLIALCDGIVAPENMLRCVFHHTSIIGFWRYWHASFNLWNKRYIYIPMGGSKVYAPKRVMNIIFVFVFTTLWHGDFEFKLLLWGSLMSILIVPELLIKRYYYGTNNVLIKRMRERQVINRYIHGIGGVMNIIILFIANLIGFGPGYDMMFRFLGIIVYKWSCVVAFIGVCFAVFCGVMVMFHVDYVEANGWKTILSKRLTNDDKKNGKANLSAYKTNTCFGHDHCNQLIC
eukprot:84612_1